MTPTSLSLDVASAGIAPRSAGVGDAAAFIAAYNSHLPAPSVAVPATPDTATPSLLAPLSALNSGSGSLARVADAMSVGGSFTPGQLLELSLQTHEFVFRCQLTATVANRSGDGVQQLFRQQA
jgi:hypothetical protein